MSNGAQYPPAQRTVLLTRPKDDRDELAIALRASGTTVVWCPVIEIADPASFEALDAAIQDIYGYDWIIFTSANGVDYFVRRLELLGHSLGELDDVQVCAIGEATADRLRDVSIHVDLVPTEARAEGVLQALSDYLGSPQALDRLNILLPRAAVARDLLPRTLVASGARVDDVPAYRTVPTGNADVARIRALLEGGGIDCVVFTSSSAVRSFAVLFDVTELRPLLDGVKVACIGEVTAVTAREYGVEVEIQPETPTFSALGAAIATYFTEHDWTLR